MTLSASAQLKITFATTAAPQNQVYIAFQTTYGSVFSASYVDATTGATTPFVININPSGPGAGTGLTNSVLLSSISGGLVTLNYCRSGLVYASIGGPVAPTGSFTAPDPKSTTDPAYNSIWQSVAEITYEGAPGDSGDISAINLVAMSSSISVVAGNQVVQQAGFTIPASALLPAIGALSSTPDQVLLKSTVGTTAGQIVRALGPSAFGEPLDSKGNLYFALGGYPSFQAYTQSVRVANKVTSITGGAGLGGGAYNFTSIVAGNGDIVTTGTYANSPTTWTITIPADYAMTDGSGVINYTQSSAIYLCASAAASTTGVNVSPAGMDAAELAQVLHDVTFGYSFGFINSATIDPVSNVAYGNEPSAAWVANAKISLLYDKLQPNQPFYNPYAQLLAASSNYTVYGFPYSDQVGKVTLEAVNYNGTPVSGWNILIGEDPFHGASLGSGWYYSAWFGYYNTTFYPWVNQLDLGFVYVDTTDGVNLYLYSPTLGWLYTSAQDFPNIYCFNQNTWIYYFAGTQSYANYTTGQIVNF